jgi:hypothetical protein
MSPWTYPISAEAPLPNSILLFDGTDIVAAHGVAIIIGTGVVSIPDGTTIAANASISFPVTVANIGLTDAIIVSTTPITNIGSLSLIAALNNDSPTGIDIVVTNLTASTFTFAPNGRFITWMVLRSS